jgi:Mg2+ and Co2+ transporter CorA
MASSETIDNAGKGKTNAAESSRRTVNNGSQQSRETYIFKILQRRPQLRHRYLTNDIERLAETAERLKTQVRTCERRIWDCLRRIYLLTSSGLQAALLINIKAEDKNVAIFIFTVVTVVFLPLSFVTSYLGMNTSDVRDMEQGQWLFWAIGGAVTAMTLLVVCILAFRGHSGRGRDRTTSFQSWLIANGSSGYNKEIPTEPYLQKPFQL